MTRYGLYPAAVRIQHRKVWVTYGIDKRKIVTGKSFPTPTTWLFNIEIICN